MALYHISSFIFLCYVLLHLSWKLWKRKLSFLPAQTNIPWLGSVPFIQKDPRKFYQERLKLSAKYNYLYVVWFGARAALRAGRVEYIEPLLRSRDRITKSTTYKMFNDWLGAGLFTANGEHWKKRRVQLTGAFHFTILNDFLDMYEQHANNLVNHLKQLIKKDDNVVEVQELMGRVMLDVICETSMGVTANALESAESKYVNAIERIKRLTMQRLFPSIKNIKFVYPYTADGKEYEEVLVTIHDFIRNVIDQNMASRKSKPGHQAHTAADDEELGSSYMRKKKRVFIDILLDLYEEGNIDIKGIEDEVNTFMFAGHDTTSTAISWILYEIGRHPEIQLQVQQEIDDLASQDLPMADKVRSLKYTECVIKESLRVHPPASGFSRRLEEDLVVEGNVIPAGTLFVVDTLAIHNNPDYWPNPQVFDPDRFNADNTSKRSPYCFIPFSAGNRNCIGQKFAIHDLKVFIFTLLLNFNVVSMQDPNELEPGIQIITSSMNGIYIKFSLRH